MKRSVRLALRLSIAAVVIAAAAPARAIPAFARKYGTSCLTCHSVYPKLTPFGEAFRRNGYRFPGIDSDYVKQDTVPLGQEQAKKGFPNQVWPATIPISIPIGVGANGQLSLYPDKGSSVPRQNNDTRVALDSLVAEAHVWSGAALSDTFTTWAELTIADGGVPRATISNSGVEWSPKGLPSLRTDPTAVLVPLGGTLTFTVTVENVGPVPIRTRGPEPGSPYTTSENFNTKKEYEEPGVWRVGLDSDGNSAGRPYPYRWQIGSSAELKHVALDGKEYLYLLPGKRVTVSGTLRIVDKPPRINVYYWVGLVQEDVRIVEDRVEPKLVTVEF